MAASQYISKVDEQLDSLLNQIDAIKKAGNVIAGAVLDGKKIYVADRYGILDVERIERASGPAFFRSYKEHGSSMKNGDVLILSAFHTDDRDDMDILYNARALEAVIITISPAGTLSQTADISLNNNDNGTNGVITVTGMNKSFGPVSGIMNAALAWTLVAETIEIFISKGEIPTVYRGEYLKEGREKNTEARKRYKSLGY